MYSPVTLVDIVYFVQSVISAFSDTLYLSFTLMISFTIIYHIKHLFVRDML